jgi:hypothetical protein
MKPHLFRKENQMSRPVESTTALDLDTVKILLWASEYGSGHPNISRLYDREAADGLDISRGTFFNAIKGRSVSNHVIAAIDELIAIRGWQSQYLEHCRAEHKRRVVKAFESPPSYCNVCGHQCSHCGGPRTEKRRKAVFDFLKVDPMDLGCKLRNDPDDAA